VGHPQYINRVHNMNGKGDDQGRDILEDEDGVDRRGYLKLVAASAVLTAGTTAQTVAVQAASNGYGEGGYGQTSYGGSTTETKALTVSTASPSSVETTSATISGSLDELGGASSVDCYFEWRATGASTWNTTIAQSLSSTGMFTADLSGLKESVEYEYRAVGNTSADGTTAGATTSFSTQKSGSAPVMNRFSVSEAGRPDPHAEVTVVWDVTDPDGDLAEVSISISNSTKGMTRTLDGSVASDVDSFKIKSGDGQTFDVNFTVTSEDGSTSDVKSVTA
jgi:hypothetical protein